MLPMSSILLVAVGSALGGVARYGVGLGLNPTQPGFPWGTLVVNVIGALAIGLLAGAGVKADRPWAWQLLAIGLLGGFTTFSSLTLEALSLIQAERLALAAGYVGASLVLGFAAVAGGWWMGMGWK